jgi:hypothetical protein
MEECVGEVCVAVDTVSSGHTGRKTLLIKRGLRHRGPEAGLWEAPNAVSEILRINNVLGIALGKRPEMFLQQLGSNPTNCEPSCASLDTRHGKNLPRSLSIRPLTSTSCRDIVRLESDFGACQKGVPG